VHADRAGDPEAGQAAVGLGAAVAAERVGLAPCPDAAAGEWRRRWAVWRSPPGQPGWARPALLGIAAVAALLYAWNITRAGYAPVYASAVKAMSESWKAFFYGASDPAATATLDKLAGSFLPQALSARVFGYHAWSLALPQVIEGVVSVLVMYRVVRRWAGVVPGLLAAAIFALTPIAASMFGHSMEDGALTMCLVLAADAWQRAVLQGRLRSLIWAGVWVGLGFQAKMLQAWMILPALAVGYLVAAPGPLRRRLAQIAAAGVVMLAVSLSWIALYTFTPASDRPYITGSTDNSAIAMVFGWDGLSRFGIHLPGVPRNGVVLVTGSGPSPEKSVVRGGRPADVGRPPHGRGSPGHAGGATIGFNLGPASPGHDWGKLLDSRFGPEIGWLYPLALLALIFGLAWRRGTGRTDPVRGGFVMWGVWLCTFGVVFSAMGVIPHTAYVASLAPPLAALSGAGIVLFWQAYRAGGHRAWVMPAAAAAELAWALYLWRSYPGFLPWARWAAVGAGAAAIAALIAPRLAHLAPGLGPATARPSSRLVTAALAVSAAAMLAAPATWSASVLDTKYAGTSFDASAGPANQNTFIHCITQKPALIPGPSCRPTPAQGRP
jgi:4-amino-4-deoxy-L-arabinose transferase-like glycosyltransferase